MEQPNKVQNFLLKSFGVDKYLDLWEKNRKMEQVFLHGNANYEENENRVWHEGKSEHIEYFYKSNYPTNMAINQYKFWRVINTQMPRLHYPLANTISRAMGTLLFNQTPEFDIDAGAQGRNKKLQKRLNEILDTNDILVLLQQSAELQSYSGAVGFKLNYDPTISSDPLITAYPQENFRVERKYGQIIYIDFVDSYKEDYKLVSRYGLGYISYQLYKEKNKVSMDAIPETSGLTDMAFFDKDNNIIPILFGAVINNKGNESQSDFKGLIDTFHALDETYSTLITYIRRTKPVTYITEDIAKKDASGRKLPLNEFDNIVEVLDSVPGENQSKIQRTIEDIKIDGYKDTLRELREFALSKVSLSPATIGLDNGGANQSGEALNIRERASGRLRDEKLSNWKEQMAKFIYSMLMFDTMLRESIEVSEGFYIVELPHDFIVKINFGEFVKESFEQKSKTYMAMYEKKLISLDFALHEIFKDEMSEDELMTLTIQTKQQNGLQLTVEQEEYLIEMREKSAVQKTVNEDEDKDKEDEEPKDKE